MLNPLVRRGAFEEREYQLRLAERAVGRNTLIVLPTAMGKTVIAALVASHFLYNHRRSKVLMMAPTRPLVIQHKETFMKLLRLKPEDVRVLTGKNPPDYRLRVWRSGARMYFTTPQVVYNDHGRGMELKEFGLLIFDECHRARKNYAYTRIAEAYVREAPFPVILGITASPGGSKQKIKEICDALFIERVEARTEEDPDVRSYVHQVTVEWKFVELPESYQRLRRTLRKMLEEKLRELSSIGAVRKNPRFTFRTDLLEAAEEVKHRLETSPLEEERGKLGRTLMLISAALSLYHALELLESQGASALRSFLRRIENGERVSHRLLTSELKSVGFHGSVDSLGEHPKLRELLETVLEQLAKDPSSKIIVFTQYRDTASHLVSMLSGRGITAKRFVGQGSRGNDKGLSQEEQTSILDEFRRGEVKVLVATSIGEEGLDIPNVDLVVFYEPIPSEIRYIQRRGRTGRGKVGRVVILAAQGTIDVNYLRASKRMAERMKTVIKELNEELRVLVRSSPPPKIEPMEGEEMGPEELPPLALEAPIEEVEEELERKRMRDFNTEVRVAAKLILRKILRAGREGLSLNKLTEEAEVEGLNPSTVVTAVNRLCDENQVEKVGDRIFSPGVSGAKDIHTLEVWRVLPGKAIVHVDNRWYASLLPSDYNGPRYLIKRGTRFRARTELYTLEGKLHAKVYAVETTLD